MKRILLLLVCAVVLASLFSCAGGGNGGNDGFFDEDGVWYMTSEDGTHAIITGCDASVTEVVILSEVGGLPVTEMAASAFAGRSELVSVHIPASVTTIGEAVFADCTSLVSITVDEESEHFKCVDGLLISTGDSQHVVHYAIGRTDATVTIPYGVEFVGRSAFMGCSALESVVIPHSMSTVPTDAFDGCDNFTTVYYTGDVEQWNQTLAGDSIFYDLEVYFYSETAPEEEGNFWHYDGDGNIAVW